MIYVKLFLQFFQIGLFSFGGGYATLPFLYHITETHKWFTTQQLTDMIAISSITPGPIGINMATFAGYTTAGIIGSALATFAIILPSYLIVILISKLLNKFNDNKNLRAAIYALKPAGCGLLAAIGVNLIITNSSLIGMLFLLAMFYISLKKKYDPLFYLGISALFGLSSGLFHLIN